MEITKETNVKGLMEESRLTLEGGQIVESDKAAGAGQIVEAEKAVEAEKGKPKEMNVTAEGFGREALQRFLGGYMASGLMAADFAELGPKARLEAVTRLAAYVMPKLKSVDMDFGLKEEERKGHDLGVLLDSQSTLAE